MFQRLRGTRDFYPEEMTARNKVFKIIRETAERHGFVEVVSPAIESFDLIAKKSGEDIKEEIYAFKDKGGRMICLIPEFTPSVSRMIANRQKELGKPLKWYSIPRHWRYERPQSGRLREFYQLNVDIFGSESPKADTEVLSVGICIMLNLGLKDFLFHISNRKFLQGLLQEYNVSNIQEAFRIIDKRDKIPEEEFVDGLLKCGIKDYDEILDILDSVTIENIGDFRGRNELMDKAIDNLIDIFRYLEYYGVREHCVLDLSIVRGLAYYTDMVFEVYDKKKEMRSLFGGGRYDDLVESFGGEHTPAVGFGMGDVVLELMMKKEGVWPEEKTDMDYYIANIGDVDRYVFSIAKKLRNKGYRVTFDLMERNLSNQLKYADKINAKKVIIVGEKEIKEGKILIRDMETGKQEKIDVNKI
ncbi:MAG: histidine--tRNA ligase [Methanomicrobia archaeon]|nr:histidine--tRNA ligase [Methanomicrobia archaeon]